jgi:hypothetical protein
VGIIIIMSTPTPPAPLLSVYYSPSRMSTQSFDVSLGDKTLTWQAPGALAPARPAPPWPQPPRPAPPRGLWRAPKPESKPESKPEPEPGPARAEGQAGLSDTAGLAGLARGCPAARQSVECQVSTLAALVVLATTHLVLLQNATALVVSAYVLVLSPLLSTFYHLPAGATAHLYALNLAAVVVLLANVRFERDLAALFFAVAAAVFLHLAAASPCAGSDAARGPAGALAPATGPSGALAAPAAALNALAPAAAAALNALAAYFFVLYADAAYNPRLHGLQALLLALDALLYAWVRAPRSARALSARAAAARSCA